VTRYHFRTHHIHTAWGNQLRIELWQGWWVFGWCVGHTTINQPRNIQAAAFAEHLAKRKLMIEKGKP